MHNNEKYVSVVADFAKNTDYLEKITGKKITSLSYPNGLYSLKVNSEIIKSGIKITFSTGNEKYIFESQTPVGRKNRAHSINIEDLIN